LPWLTLGRTLQVYHLARVAGTFGVGIGVARLVAEPELIAPFESVMVLYTALASVLYASLPSRMLVGWGSVAPTRRWVVQRQAFVVAAWGGLVAAVACGAMAYSQSGFGWMHALGVALFAAGSVSAIPVEYLHWCHGNRGRMLLLGLSSVGLFITAHVVPLALGWGFQGVFGALALLGLLRGTLALAVWKPWQPSEVAPARLRRWLWVRLWPLMGYAASAHFTVMGVALLAQWMLSPAEFVLLRYGTREVPITLVIANTLSVSMAALVAQQGLTNGTEAFGTLRVRSRELMWPFAALCLPLLVFAPYLMTSVYGPAFAPAGVLFGWYVLLVIPRLLFPQAILNGLNQPGYVFRVGLIESLLHLALAALLLPLLGLEGAGIAAFAAYTTEKILLMVVLQRVGVPTQQYTPWVRWGLVTTVLAVAWGVARVVI
jgi:O-antigen/teichoic acid export membrane protein